MPPMACAAPVIGSITAPVREVICNHVQGRLVNFFDADAVAALTAEAILGGSLVAEMRVQAQSAVQGISQTAGLVDYDRRIGAKGFDEQVPTPQIDALLSRVERELLDCLAAGHSNEEIAKLTTTGRTSYGVMTSEALQCWE